jgi:hypothetical protein
MPASRIGPVILATAGDAFVQSAQISAILWKGTTVAGDQVVLKHRIDGQVLWEGQTDGTNTYLGATLPPSGMSAPHGFVADRLDNGKLLIYLAEK